MAVERAAVRSVEDAQRRLDVAMADFDVHTYAAATDSDVEVMVREVERATHARLGAVVAQARGRGGLVAAVSVLGALWDDEATLDEVSPSQVTARTAGELGLDAAFGISLQRVDQSAAAAAVVAEATAIALAADAQVAAEMKASAILAARTTKDAVRAAAVTVAHAAESARAEQELAVADAAAGVAADVIRTAIDVQARAEEWAAAEAVAVFSRAAIPRDPTELAVANKMAEHAADAAAAQVQETALAAEVVAIMVAASAAAVADAADTLAAATARHVRHSAKAVQAVADAAALGVAASTAEAARAAAKAAALRQSARQLGGWDPRVTPKPIIRLAKNVAAASAVAVDDRRNTSAMPVDVHAPAVARAHVARVLHADGVGEDVLEVVELLVSEVVTNVVQHQASHVLEVAVAVDVDQAVTVTVSGGDGLASVALVNPPGRPGPASESGRGLELLDSLASVWGTRREYRTTAVWFTVRAAERAADSAGG